MNKKNKFVSIKPEKSIIGIADCIAFSAQVNQQISLGITHIILDFINVIELTGSFAGFFSRILKRVESMNGDLFFTNLNSNCTDVLITSGFAKYTKKFNNITEEYRKKALIITNNEFFAQSVKSNLNSLGYDSFESDNGIMGLSLVKQHKKTISFIILSIELNATSGIDILQKIVDNNPNAKVIMLSAEKNISQLEEIKSIIDIPVISPFLIDELELAIDAIINPQNLHLLN